MVRPREVPGAPQALPCWEDLSPELQKRRIEEIAREIEDESKARLEERGIPPLGPDAIRRQSPDTIPPRSKKSPAPLVLAASKRVRDDLGGGRAQSGKSECALPGRKLSVGDALRQWVIRLRLVASMITTM